MKITPSVVYNWGKPACMSEPHIDHDNGPARAYNGMYQLFALPVRDGDLNLIDPAAFAQTQYRNSLKVTKPLTFNHHTVF